LRYSGVIERGEICWFVGDVGEIGDVVDNGETVEIGGVGDIEDSVENGDDIRGGVAGRIGATPELLSSDAPSGIVPPLSVVSPGWPGVDSGEALPGYPAVVPEGTAVQPL
jgi:hypothetical protein